MPDPEGLTPEQEPASNDIERLMVGHCNHGQGSDCLTCAMTRSMVVGLRRMLSAMFPPNGGRRG